MPLRRVVAIVLIALMVTYDAFGQSIGQPQKVRPVDTVNVFTGTSNSRWMLFPGATLPMGLVKMSPDNQGNVWNGGYEYTVASLTGFSFLHTLGLASFNIMPLIGSLENDTGQAKLFPGPSDGPFGGMWTSGYRSRIDKSKEAGKPGYYTVDLIDSHSRVELTATERTGWMRITPTSSGRVHLILDFGLPAEEQGEFLKAWVKGGPGNEITGSVTQRNKYAGAFTVYFDMQLSRKVTSMGSWENGAYLSGGDTNYGVEWRRPRTMKTEVTSFETTRSGGVWLDLDDLSTEPIVVRTGISLVGTEQAHGNLVAEGSAHGFDFNSVSRAAGETWNRLLSRVEIKGGTNDDRVKFYTSLYRVYTGKALLDDVDGSYRDACGEVQHLPVQPGLHLYSSDALWGAQWDLGPLWSLLNPELLSGFDAALVLEAERGGWLPSGTPNLRYAPIMDAHHEMALITGAWQKGIRGFNGQNAYAAMRKVLTSPAVPYTCDGRYPEGVAGDRHMASYMKLGYVPEEDGPASSTFEYAYDDACAATMARALGKSADADMFEERSRNWRNSLSPVSGFAQRRRVDGSWVEPNDLYRFGTTGGWSGPGFLEATPWIYSWFVPQDVQGLVQMIGRDRFNERLQKGFLEKHVDLTNEPNLQAPWLFNYSGQSWLTQKYAREVFQEIFDTSPLNGWPGEEDEGQMGAYLVLAGVGLFDMEGGCADRPVYQISGPAFDEVTLHLSGGDFHIVAHNNSATNVYIQSAKLNGKPLSSLSIAHADMVHGGTLHLEMDSHPLMKLNE